MIWFPSVLPVLSVNADVKNAPCLGALVDHQRFEAGSVSGFMGLFCRFRANRRGKILPAEPEGRGRRGRGKTLHGNRGGDETGPGDGEPVTPRQSPLKMFSYITAPLSRLLLLFFLAEQKKAGPRGGKVTQRPVRRPQQRGSPNGALTA